MPEVQNTLTKYTNKQSCSNPNAIIHSGQGAMEIHVSCACMFEGSVMPWVQTGLFSPQGKYTRKYWCYRIIYRVEVAKEINCILHWALPVHTGTHLRAIPLPERWVLTCTPLSVTMSNAVPYARRLLAGTLRPFRYWTSTSMGRLPAHSGIYSNAMYLCSCYMQAPPNLSSVALLKYQEACDGTRTLQQYRESF